MEDGEIPSDEDDEPTPPPPAPKPVAEPAKPAPKPESPKHKSFDSKFSKSKKQSGSSSGSGSKQERFNKYKNPSEDWAGDVEKAIRAVLEEQVRPKGQENNKSKCKSNRSKNRKRAREEKEEERSKDQKVSSSKVQKKILQLNILLHNAIPYRTIRAIKAVHGIRDTIFAFSHTDYISVFIAILRGLLMIIVENGSYIIETI